MPRKADDDFRLILIDPSEELCDSFEMFFGADPRVTIARGAFESLEEFDCMVSAANSFGLMDGGVDLAITNFFGDPLMDRVQRHIIENYRGEQSVGDSFIIETGHAKHPYLAHTPTMRVPMRVTTLDNVYRAMFAALLAVWRHNQTDAPPIRLVACPGLGTGCGGLTPYSAARQMSLAWQNFHNPPSTITWPFARDRQKTIGLGGDAK